MLASIEGKIGNNTKLKEGVRGGKAKSVATKIIKSNTYEKDEVSSLGRNRGVCEGNERSEVAAYNRRIEGQTTDKEDEKFRINYQKFERAIVGVN